jgi:hypothetical protein
MTCERTHLPVCVYVYVCMVHYASYLVCVWDSGVLAALEHTRTGAAQRAWVQPEPADCVEVSSIYICECECVCMCECMSVCACVSVWEVSNIYICECECMCMCDTVWKLVYTRIYRFISIYVCVCMRGWCFYYRTHSHLTPTLLTLHHTMYHTPHTIDTRA